MQDSTQIPICQILGHVPSFDCSGEALGRERRFPGTWPGSFAERFVRDRTPRESSNNGDMFSTRLVAASLALLTTTGTGGNSGDNQARSMAFAGIGEINGDLFAIRGKIGPSGFFENLRSVDSKDGAVFRSNVGEVRFFPDRVTVTLLIIGPFTKRARGSGPDAQYMEGMKFKAQWKRGVELRPVKAFRQLTASVTEPPEPPDVPWLAKECWIYEFVIEDPKVPINDHLILSVMSPENKRLARLSAYL